MSRTLSPAMLAELAAGTVYPVLFYEGQFAGGILRLWTGVGTVNWNGESWTGGGQAIAVSPSREASGLEAVNFTVSLMGELGSIVSAALSQCRQGLPGRIWFGMLSSTGVVIGDPFMCFAGRLDRPDITDDGTTATVTVAYESRLVDFGRPRARRYTHEDQQLRSPGDRGFEFVPSLQDAVIVLGKF